MSGTSIRTSQRQQSIAMGFIVRVETTSNRDKPNFSVFEFFAHGGRAMSEGYTLLAVIIAKFSFSEFDIYKIDLPFSCDTPFVHVCWCSCISGTWSIVPDVYLSKICGKFRGEVRFVECPILVPIFFQNKESFEKSCQSGTPKNASDLKVHF